MYQQGDLCPHCGLIIVMPTDLQAESSALTCLGFNDAELQPANKNWGLNRAALELLLQLKPKTTPHRNTIPVHREAPIPGDLFMERRIRSLIRYNAIAQVIRNNRAKPGQIGRASCRERC